MAVYAYRWSDGTVSVCYARNKEEAFWLLDEVGPVSRKLIMRLKAEVLFTCKFDVERGWTFDEADPFGETLSLELPRRCYPRFNAEYLKCLEHTPSGKFSAKDLSRLRRALAKDASQAIKRIEKAPDLPDEFKFNPKGFPGQNN